MSIVVNLTPAEEAYLSTEAGENGLPPEEFAAQVLRDHFDGKRTSPDEVFAKLRQWQKETATKTAPAVSTDELFARWAEEDAAMTHEEKRKADELWEEIQSGLNETRAELGMRQL